MFENLYTTKMSMDKKKLQNRFLKIRSKNGRLSKLMAVGLFAVILLIIAAATLIIALNATDDRYIMTDKEFEDYGYRPIGSIMAELDYTDEEKLVFHYLEGFFVVDQVSGEIIHKINLNKLNVAPHTQGNAVLDVSVDKEGKFAYLTSQGAAEYVKKFDEYIINLATGEVREGKASKDTEMVTYAAAMYPEGLIEGWYDTRTFITEDKSYLLTAREYNVGAIELVTFEHKADMIGYKYVFGGRFVDVREKKQTLINNLLLKEEEILTNSGMQWTVDEKTLSKVWQILKKSVKVPNIDTEFSGEYDIEIYAIWDNEKEKGHDRIFIIDNTKMKVLIDADLDSQSFEEIIRILTIPAENLMTDSDSALKIKTTEFLNKEFHRVYDPHYDIQTLTISDWEESGNEATFWYKMTYLNYNRNPNKAEYIQEAKKRGEKEYATLYADYLAPKSSNYCFKVVDNDGELKLYSNEAPVGTNWQPVKIDDYVGGE